MVGGLVSFLAGLDFGGGRLPPPVHTGVDGGIRLESRLGIVRRNCFPPTN